jgi:nitrogen regulatory protein PII
LELVDKTIKKYARSGESGDGEIAVSDLENLTKITPDGNYKRPLVSSLVEE